SLHTTYTFSDGYHDMTRGGFPHSDILGSQFGCQLPEAYRTLPRPSSAPLAKASTVRPSKLTATQRHFALKKLLTRCSRPLCSSQKTTPHPHHQHNSQPWRGGPATHPQKTGVACSLTTQ